MPLPYSAIHIIYNPNSTGDSAVHAKELQSALRNNRVDVPVFLVATKRAGHAQELAESIAQKEAEPLIVSASGDGGYNEVVNGVMQSGNVKAVCVVLPSGNANDHGRTLYDKPIVDVILDGNVSSIDLLQVTVRGESGKERKRYAHSYVGLGLTPVVAIELNKHDLNAIKEASITVRSFFRHRPFAIKHDGAKLKLDSLIFANIHQMAKVLTLAKETEVQDGAFEVVTLRSGNKSQLLLALLRSALGKPVASKQTTEYGFEVLKKLPVQYDGEVDSFAAGDTVEVRSAAGAIKTLL